MLRANGTDHPLMSTTHVGYMTVRIKGLRELMKCCLNPGWRLISTVIIHASGILCALPNEGLLIALGPPQVIDLLDVDA
jgi:hypothetical protein